MGLFANNMKQPSKNILRLFARAQAQHHSAVHF